MARSKTGQDEEEGRQSRLFQHGRKTPYCQVIW